MHQSKLVFSQFMAHLPMNTFRRWMAKHRGDHKGKDFSCLDQFFAMAFAQPSYQESLRDIEVILRAQANRPYHMGFRFTAISRNPLLHSNTNMFSNQIGVFMMLYASKDDSGKRIKAFLDTSENAVKAQIWIAVGTCVLVAIVKKRLHLPHCLYETLQFLSLTMLETSPINQLLTPPSTDSTQDFEPMQVVLH
ncbi:MAG: DUF4372 domain-containing protein [Hylemonella sp.]|nr:DUF4372 domain-containing protein [Hylemonella sp.]